jgi:hypothetical protein
MTAGKTGPSEFYSGRVVSFDTAKRSYQVIFDDQLKKRYDVNLTNPKSGDYVPQANWKKLG